jgi:hypothetical protein
LVFRYIQDIKNCDAWKKYLEKFEEDLHHSHNLDSYYLKKEGRLPPHMQAQNDADHKIDHDCPYLEFVKNEICLTGMEGD